MRYLINKQKTIGVKNKMIKFATTNHPYYSGYKQVNGNFRARG